ncbi:unnamed protein product [Rotaria sordida]|uniref:Uncharacterized protein n=1 Tax=Rotaria sordida TaxID=392033 RepID=A0A814HW21_9BILA|nr:unnamed protein product [Rotaria sordida]CAF3528614.1 unnamed protein product [Rotaria sordida]
MTCGKLYDKLWNNYLIKYGDFRERLQTIRNDHECFMQLQLPRIKQKSLNIRVQSLTSIKKPLVDVNNRKFDKKCHPLLPSECCHSPITKKNHLLTLNQTDLDDLEKLIEAENFPNNIFQVNTRSRSSIDNGTDFTVTNNILDDNHQLSSKRLTSPLNSMFGKTNVNHSISQCSKQSSICLLSNSHTSIQKSELGTTSQLASSAHNQISNCITNPYAKLLERLRQDEKPKLKNFNTKFSQKSFDLKINTNTHCGIQKLLSFLHSLDDNTTDNEQNSNIFDENTLIDLFSIDNHLSSSIYVPTNIHQLDIIPKILHQSLKNTSDNEQILSKIQDEVSQKNVTTELNSKMFKNSKIFLNINKQQLYSHDDSLPSNFTEQNNQLNSKLFNTYSVKAFKEFLIHNKKSTRLPKLFHDIDQWEQK